MSACQSASVRLTDKRASGDSGERRRHQRDRFAARGCVVTKVDLQSCHQVLPHLVPFRQRSLVVSGRYEA